MADPVTVELTGRLPFLLILAAVLTWPVAIGLLALYTRSVQKSMRRRALAGPAPASALEMPRVASDTSGAPRELLRDAPSAVPSAGAESLFQDLLAGPWRAAAVYTAATFAYALVTTVALFVATSLEVLPIRFLMLFVTFSWPSVLIVGIVAAAVRRLKGATTAVYFLAVFALGAMSMSSSPDLTWGQVTLLWALYNLPATVLLLTCLARPVRAVGPLILTFMFVAFVGSDAAIQIAGSDESYLRLIIDATDMFGMGGVATFIALIAAGFAAFSLVGWMALTWIKRRYQAKLISDESVTVDAVLLLFAVTHSIGLVFEHVAWAFTGVVAFAVYKVTVRAGFAWLGRGGPARAKAPRLLLLRSFSIGRDSERLFDALEKHWRRVGSIQLIAGVDLARRSVEPHEFLDFVSGKLARRFIDGSETLALRMSELDARPDRDLRFRVNDFFCHDDTWKTVLSRLVHESDAVLMDLRGFSRQNSGCAFEIQELVAQVPLERVVFVTNSSTDRRLLDQTLSDAAGRQGANRAEARSHAGVFRLQSMGSRELRRLLLALAIAAEPSQGGA